MKYWILADPHLGQIPDPAKAERNVFGRPANFSDRILRGLKGLHAGDVLICLGDVCFKDAESWHKKIVDACPQVLRWLILGNHDEKSQSWYIDHGWHFVGKSFLMIMYGHRILFSHKPQARTGEFSLNIHGHFHNTEFWKHEPELASILTYEHRLISLESSGFTPVNLKTVIDSPEHFLPRIPSASVEKVVNKPCPECSGSGNILEDREDDWRIKCWRCKGTGIIPM